VADANLNAPACYALFVAGAAVLLSGLLADRLLRLLGFTPTTPQGIAVAKFLESLLRVAAILILIPIGGQGWRSLYLQKGRGAMVTWAQERHL
jgi:hypothetical protein